MKWYIVYTLSGQEKKTKAAIEKIVESEGLSGQIGEVLVPTEIHTKMRGGKKVSTERKVMPGYVFLQMDLNNETWAAVKRVCRFLESNGKPQSISEKEVMSIVQQAEDGAKNEESEIIYSVSEVVKIIDGAFESFNGTIEEVDMEKRSVKVLVSIFGRATPVELRFDQIEKSGI